MPEYELTVVILTYERPFVATAQISSLMNKNVKLLILDGSKEENKRLEAMVKNRENIEYVWGIRGLSARFRQAAQLLDTKYVLTFTDDDYLCIKSIEYIIETMKSEGNFCAYGRTITAFRLPRTWGFNIWDPPYSELQSRRVDSDIGFERTLEHFSDYVTTYLYSVMESKRWKKVFGSLTVEPWELSCPYIYELYVEYLAAFFSKAKIEDVLSTLRMKDLPPTLDNAKESYMNNLRVYEWISDEEYAYEYAALINSILTVIPKECPNLGTSEIYQNFEQCLEKYAINEEKWFRRRERESKKATLMIRIVSSINMRLREISRRFPRIPQEIVYKKEIINLTDSKRIKVFTEDIEEFLVRLKERGQ